MAIQLILLSREGGIKMGIFKNMKAALIISAAIVFIIGSGILFTVSEYEKVIIVRLS